MIRCQHCGAETSNGLALCDLCRRKAGTIFEFLPVYFRNLARWRPGRAGSRQVPGSRVLYDGVTKVGTGDRIADALDETLIALTTWARAFIDDRRPTLPRPLTFANAALLGELPEEITDHPAKVAAGLCSAFEEHLTSIATLDWCGEFVRDIDARELLLRGLTEESVPGWYAGGCRHCGYATFVVPGLTWVTCGHCGASTFARDHLETVLTEAREWVARPKRIAEALVALLDSEESVPRLHKRISKWGEREQIEPLRRLDEEGDPVGPKRFRLGEVLDRLKAEGQTRPEPESVQVS